MPKFSEYTGKLRLGGSVLNEIPKENITAPEAEVLRAIHGADALLDLKKVGEVEREHGEERTRINELYASSSSNIDGQREKKLRVIRDLFGNDRLPLPTALDEIDALAEAAGDPGPGDAPPKRVSRVGRQTDAFA